MWQSLLGLLVGGGVLFLVAIGYQVFRKREGMGGGDIKLLAMIGAFLGLPGVLYTLFASSLVGSLAGLLLMFKDKSGGGTRIPFGPFLALGFCGVWLKQWSNPWHATDLPRACLSYNLNYFSLFSFNLGTYLACYCL